MQLSVLPTSLAPHSLSPRSLHILYAEDVRELREIARHSFSRDGHRIECVEDGLVGLRRVTADGAFDLVITDHHMPNMSGLEFATALRDLAFPGKIMLFSSNLGEAITEQYHRLKIDRILYKPIYPAMLRQVIAELFPAIARPEARSPNEEMTDRPLSRPLPRG